MDWPSPIERGLSGSQYFLPRASHVRLIFLLLLLPVLDLRADQFDTLRTYWQNYLLTNAGSASSVAANANSLWSSMDTSSGRSDVWSYLPLGSDSANLTTTFQQLEQMALAYAMPGSSLEGNASLAAAIDGGLNFVCTNYYSPASPEYGNWYDWEIGSPQALNNAATLMYPTLTPLELTNYVNSENAYAPGSAFAEFGWMTGANTSDKCLVAIICGILCKNAGQITEGQTNLSPVFLYVSSGDGFHTDGSFVFHTVIAYNGHYGLVLLGDIPEIVNLLQGSTWQITDPNLTNVYNWVSASFEPLVYDNAMMDMVRGRIVSWSYETESGDADGTYSAVRNIAGTRSPKRSSIPDEMTPPRFFETRALAVKTTFPLWMNVRTFSHPASTNRALRSRIGSLFLPPTLIPLSSAS